MDDVIASCLLLLLANIPALIECDGRPVVSAGTTETPRRKDPSERLRCYRTALCETCSQSEVRCYDNTELSPLIAKKFKDDFCGHHGVVLVEKRSGRSQNLLPLECINGICPDQSECKKNQADNLSYCCSLEKLATSRCFSLDVPGGSKEAVTRKITDESGNPVNISRVTLIQEKSDEKCLQGWSYFFMDDTVYLSNPCPVRFEICYEPKPSTRISTNSPAVETTCEILGLSSDGVAEKRFEDSHGRPVIVTTMDLVDWHSLPCRKGVTFTFSGSVVRVTGGCRGNFRVCYLNNTDPEEVTTTLQVPVNEQECLNMTLLSHENSRFLHSLDYINRRLHIVSMELVNQLSTVQCIQWLNYYSEGSTALSKEGCSGEFEVCYLVNVTVTPVSLPEPAGKTCRLFSMSSSGSGETERVVTDVRGGNVTIRNMTLARQISQTACVEGTTFSFHGSKAVSREGCIGTFQICYDAIDLHITAPRGELCDIEVTLSSNISHHGEHTLTDSQGSPLAVQSMILLKQFSEVQCVERHSYLIIGSTVYTRDGCTGTFKVCYNISDSQTTESSPLPGTTPQSGPQCENVKLMSSLTLPVKKTFVNSDGNQLPIISVKLVEQISTVKCAVGVTFKVYQYGLQVLGGCKAVFKVCVGTPVEDTTTPVEDTTTPAEDMTTTSTPTESTGEECLRLQIGSRRADKRKLVKIVDNYKRPVRITSVEVEQQITDVPCRLWKTFHYEDNIVRANGGCKALFKVCFEKESLSSPKEECMNMTLRSRPGTTKAADIRDKRGNPVRIVHVEVLRQMSYVPCVKRQTYNYDGGVLRASDGCSALFKICYSKKGR